MQKVQRIPSGQALTTVLYTNAITFVICLILSKAVLLDAISPLAAALCLACCLCGMGGHAAALGCIAGGLLFGSKLSIFAGAAVGGMYTVLSVLDRDIDEILLAIPFGIAAIINVAFTWRGSLFGVLTGVLEAILAVAIAYALKNAITGVRSLMENKALKDSETMALMFGFCLLLTGTAGLKVFGLDIMRTLALLATMVVAASTTMEWSAGAGLIMGFTMCIAGNYNPLSIGGLGVCALVGSAFRKMGRFGVLLGFVLCNSLFTLYVNGSTEVLLPLGEIALGGLMLVIMPRAVLEGVAAFIDHGTNAEMAVDSRYLLYREMLTQRLEGLTNALAASADTLQEGKRLPGKKELDIKAAQRLAMGCRECSGRDYCWKENSERSIAIAGRMLRDYLSNGQITIYKEMADDCMDTDRLQDNARKAFEAIAYEQYESSRLRTFRDATAAHLQEISHITGELATGQRPEYTRRLEQGICERLRKEGHAVLAVAARADALGRLRVRVEMEGCTGDIPCREQISRSVSKVTGKLMRVVSQPCEGKEERCTVTLFETSRMEITAGAAAMKREGSQISGDHYSICRLDDGRYFACLCDGMGSGKEAANAGRIGAKMIETFFRAGYDKDRILQTVNSVMAMSGNEVFTTADVCLIDLVERTCEFFKSGAANSFIISGDHAESISGEALPIGVVDNALPSQTTRSVKEGDTILLLSDGVTEATDGDVKELLDTCSADSDPKAISEEIIRLAIKKAGGKRDDMTAIVIQIN